MALKKGKVLATELNKVETMTLGTFNHAAFMRTVKNCRFDRCILDWTNQCKSHCKRVRSADAASFHLGHFDQSTARTA